MKTKLAKEVLRAMKDVLKNISPTNVKRFAQVGEANFQISGLEVHENQQSLLFMPPTLKKLMGHIAFGAWVRGSHFLYVL